MKKKEKAIIPLLEKVNNYKLSEEKDLCSSCIVVVNLKRKIIQLECVIRELEMEAKS